MDRKGLAILILAAVILLLLFAPKASSFSLSPKNGGVTGANLGNTLPSMYGGGYAHSSSAMNKLDGHGAPYEGAGPAGDDVSSASLIPREVVQTEDFGQFSPDKILSGQNYLDPRNQIGYPETVGGVLRNANQQFRSEPINPRNPVSIFNLSTIPPDTMRPKFEISPEYQ
jgi:hypothetical protein